MMKTQSLPAVRTMENVTLEQFRDDILPGGVPVLMKDFVADWPAVQVGKTSPAAMIAYLKQLDTKQPVPTTYGDPKIDGKFFYNEDLSDLNFQGRPAVISDTLDQLAELIEAENPPALNIQSTRLHSQFPGFVERNGIRVLPPVIEPRIWIGNRLTVQTHFDLFENIACVVAGHRRFTLFPPEQTPNLYVGPFELTPAGPPISLAQLDAPDFDRHPKFREALDSAMVAEMGPGDAIFIPYFWWHHVQSLDAFNVLVNYWWNEAPKNLAPPFDALLHGMIAIRDLPPHQRAAWKIMFEQYVFKDNGDPSAHLPEQAKGALGPHTPDMLKHLKTVLANNLAMQAGLVSRPHKK